MSISLATADDLELLVSHIERQVLQSGKHGAPIYTPCPPGHPPESARMRRRRLEGWSLPLSEPGWVRTFALWHEDRIVGHAELCSGRLATELHRASLGMGIEWEHRRRGHGKRLLQHLIDWARQAELAWIDLGVFESNKAARALYRGAGFVEVGRREDQFRVHGESITDIQMSLRLA